MSHEQTRGGTLRTDSAQHVTPLRQRNHRVHGSRTSCVLMCNCCSRLRRKLSIRARSSSLAVCCGGKHDIPHRNNGRLRPTAHTTDAKHTRRVTSRQLVAPSSPLGCASPEFDPNCFQRRAACLRRAAPCRCRRTRASSAASLQPLPGSPDRPRRGKTTATTSPPPPPSHHSTHRLFGHVARRPVPRRHPRTFSLFSSSAQRRRSTSIFLVYRSPMSCMDSMVSMTMPSISGMDRSGFGISVRPLDRRATDAAANRADDGRLGYMMKMV